MKNIEELVRTRRSVRTYDGRPVPPDVREKLLAFAQAARNPFDVPVEFRLLEAKEHGLVCPVVTGTDLYIAGKVDAGPDANAAFGYSFELLVLYAQSLGLGTVWLGGTMNRSAYETAMQLSSDELMPCASPLGFPAEKMSVRESVMRRAIRADERLAFEELFFDGSPAVPLTKEKAGKLALPLEMVRLAPSAVNKQPWRVVAADGAAHFYLQRSKGFSHEGRLDMQMIDMGIALCHFALAAQEHGLDVRFEKTSPLPFAGAEYVATCRFG